VRFTDEAEYFVSEASVYRLLKAHDLIASPAHIVINAAEAFKDKTTAPNQLWQTDFTYLKITGWVWYYLSTVLDDFTRFIIAWKLCATMKAKDVTATLDLALFASGLHKMRVVHRPRLLSDNGASYVAEDLAAWLNRQKIEHVRSAPYHPQTQGKIERWHQTLKNRILLEHYYLPGDLERQVAAFVARCGTTPVGSSGIWHRVRTGQEKSALNECQGRHAWHTGVPRSRGLVLSARMQHVVCFRPRKAAGAPRSGVAMGRGGGRFRSSARKLATQIALGCVERTSG
jgi:transposase InsO family protein